MAKEIKGKVESELDHTHTFEAKLTETKHREESVIKIAGRTSLDHGHDHGIETVVPDDGKMFTEVGGTNPHKHAFMIEIEQTLKERLTKHGFELARHSPESCKAAGGV